MLSSLFDRVWTPVIIYIALASGAYALRDVANSVLLYGSVAAATFYYAQVFATAVICEYKIDRLGKRAPSNRSWTPWNVGWLCQAIWYFSQHRNHEWWSKMFKENGNPNLPYTVEAIVVGDRITFTADEENIKAILATQFADYGKGPQFRKEWKDFLGLSKSMSMRRAEGIAGLTFVCRHLHY